MTPQEEQLLNALIERINQTQLQEKDPDAEALLARTLGSNPNALYILAQTVLVQNFALEQGKAQLDQAKTQLDQLRQQPPPEPAHASSFLGGFFGHGNPQPQPAYTPPPPPPAQFQPPPFQPVASYQPPPQQAPVAYEPAPPPSQPSFLRGAMQTAAGVAAGALAFEGVESVLHGLGGFGHPGFGWGGPGLGMGGLGMGSGMMGAGFDRPVEETVINNNYYDDPGAGQGDRNLNTGSTAGFDAGHETGHEAGFHSEPDQGSRQFADTSYDASDAGNFDAGDNSGFDNSNFDDSGNGGFDDGGGFDPGVNV